MNADGSGARQVTSGSAFDIGPSFSPDGNKVVFSSTRTGLGDMYTVNRDGTGLRRLTTGNAIELSPSWSSN